MKYKIVNSSDNTEIGTILGVGEVEPILKIENKKLYDTQGREFILIEDPVKVPDTGSGMGLGVIALVAVIVVVAFVSLRKK
jgi:hypothetical protein